MYSISFLSAVDNLHSVPLDSRLARYLSLDINKECKIFESFDDLCITGARTALQLPTILPTYSMNNLFREDIASINLHGMFIYNAQEHKFNKESSIAAVANLQGYAYPETINSLKSKLKPSFANVVVTCEDYYRLSKSFTLDLLACASKTVIPSKVQCTGKKDGKYIWKMCEAMPLPVIHTYWNMYVKLKVSKFPQPTHFYIINSNYFDNGTFFKVIAKSMY